MTVKTRPFDPAAYLDTPEAIAAYMTEALDSNDPGFIADALGVIARAGHDPSGAGGGPVAGKPVPDAQPGRKPRTRYFVAGTDRAGFATDRAPDATPRAPVKETPQ